MRNPTTQLAAFPLALGSASLATFWKSDTKRPSLAPAKGQSCPWGATPWVQVTGTDAQFSASAGVCIDFSGVVDTRAKRRGFEENQPS